MAGPRMISSSQTERVLPTFQIQATLLEPVTFQSLESELHRYSTARSRCLPILNIDFGVSFSGIGDTHRIVSFQTGLNKQCSTDAFRT